jgi:hypothetical protein
MSAGWQVIPETATVNHVIPIHDQREHVLSKDCHCCPRDDEGVMVHNSYDGREIAERAEVSASGSGKN